MVHSQITEFLELQAVLDQFKMIVRKSAVPGREQRENDAEHSWHLAMWFLSISHMFTRVNITKILIMLLIHDLPEIYAGDAYAFSKNSADIEKEREAAKKIFRLFPRELSSKYYCLWIEFEEGITREAKIARSFDALQPILQNIMTRGKIWKENGITLEKLDAHKRPLMIHDHIILEIYEELLARAARFI